MSSNDGCKAVPQDINAIRLLLQEGKTSECRELEVEFNSYAVHSEKIRVHAKW